MDSPDHRIVIVVDPALAPGLLANTVATIAIGLGAARPGFGAARLADAAGREFSASANRPVPILQASEETLRALLVRAQPPTEGGVLVPFPRFARALHHFDAYAGEIVRRDLHVEPIDGLGLAGPAKWVASLTGSLKLLR